MSLRTTWHRLWMGLATVTGLSQKGYFIPYRYAGRIAALPGPRYKALAAQFDARREAFSAFMHYMESYAQVFEKIGELSPPEPRWRQVWFPRLDGAAAYAMVRQMRPRRIVEIGSGHSTRFLAKAVIDEELQTHLTAIDPAPRADISALPGIETIEQPVSACGEQVFQALSGGDMLMIDSSHILMPGSDVDFLLNQVLPQLSAGVIVHFHDICLPDDYPAVWRWRGYNEQQGVAALLQGGAYEILFSSHYVTSRMPETVADGIIGRLDIPEGAFETSLWLKKNQ